MALPQGGCDLHVPAVHLQGLSADDGGLSYPRQGVGKGARDSPEEAGFGEFFLLPLLTLMAILLIAVMVGMMMILSLISRDST